MAFYVKVNAEMRPLVEVALKTNKKMERKLRALIQVKFDYFQPTVDFQALSPPIPPIRRTCFNPSVMIGGRFAKKASSNFGRRLSKAK